MRSKVRFEDIDLANRRYVRLDVYQGLRWSNFDAYDPANVERKLPKNGEGFLNGVVSGHQVAFSLQSTYASISADDGSRFNLKSAYLTSAFLETDSVTVSAYQLGVEVYRHVFDITKAAPTLTKFGIEKIDSVFFSSASLYPIVFDNVLLTHAPNSKVEPLSQGFAHHDAPALGDGHGLYWYGHMSQPDLHQLA